MFKSVNYDPNNGAYPETYGADDDDDDYGMDIEDEYEDDDYSFDSFQDVDDSWKVRKAAIVVINSVIKNRPDFLSLISKE